MLLVLVPLPPPPSAEAPSNRARCAKTLSDWDGSLGLGKENTRLDQPPFSRARPHYWCQVPRQDDDEEKSTSHWRIIVHKNDDLHS
eukprot:scaffold107181_cov62-Attheya_sp.AAC.1